MLILLLAAAVYVTHLDIDSLFQWLKDVFGVGFTLIYVSLVGLSIYSGLALLRTSNPQFWYEAGMQSASAVATLALTFTLLGISLGIGTLAGQELSPDSVQPVIRELTRQFSTAFMTTVVGLPTSGLLRAFIALRAATLESQEISL